MRLRYKLVTYHFGENEATQQSLERHYQKLMEEVLRSGQQRLNAHVTEWRPASDIHETASAILVKMELAGMREEDIEVTLYEDALVVSGRREDDADHESEMAYHEAQIRYGPFRAEMLLPCSVKRDEVEARYENGFLRITLPKLAETGRDERRLDVQRGPTSSPRGQPLQASGVASGSASGAEDEPVPAGPTMPASSPESLAVLIRARASGPLAAGLARGGLNDA